MVPSAGITRAGFSWKAGVQFLVDYRIGLGEQVAFTVETRKLPVNTWSV
jgi:hypothetical protein